jgi:hypothetical protein
LKKKEITKALGIEFLGFKHPSWIRQRKKHNE